MSGAKLAIMLLCCLVTAVCGCPAEPENAASTPGEKLDAAIEQNKEDRKQASDDFKEGADKLGAEIEETAAQAKENAGKLGAEVQEGADQAAQSAKEGYANFTDEVKREYPKLVESMQSQFDSMNSWAVEKYEASFAPDAPERDKLVDSFKTEAAYKPNSTVESFQVESTTDTVAVAKVKLAYTGTDVAKPLATVRKQYRYTFHKAAGSDHWKVYHVESIE